MLVAAPPWPDQTSAERAVALEVLIHGPLSRIEIARRLGLSQPTLTRVTAPLIEQGLVAEADVDEQPRSRSGRPAKPLDVVTEARQFLGVKLTGTDAHMVLTDFRSQVLAAADRPLPDRDPQAVVAVIAGLARRLGKRAPAVAALGVGLGARVTPPGSTRPVVEEAPFLGWADLPLAAMLTDATGLPTVVENDIAAYTEFEHWFGAGKGLDRFAVLTVGAAIGYGSVVHDRILLGPDSGLGLMGHWPVETYGPLCPDGHQGCAQALIAAPSIEARVSSALGRSVEYDECLTLAADGDPAARRVVDEAGGALGRLVAAVANLTLPQRIVLGGEGVRLAHVARAAIDAGIARDRHPHASRLDVHVNDHDVLRWCRGAAAVAIQAYVRGETAAVA